MHAISLVIIALLTTGSKKDNSDAETRTVRDKGQAVVLYRKRK